MYKRILLALDMEGVNYVVGEPYSWLKKGCEQWKIAVEEGTKEINAAAAALFAAGAERVDVWDNHNNGNNLRVEEIDPRVSVISHDPYKPRMGFAAGEYDCICFFGYHSMEGTLGGVLSHTMNSDTIQYYKLDGRYIGEFDMDAGIAAVHGMPCRFFAGGDVACAQVLRTVPDMVCVHTKTELGMNEAVFRGEDLYAEIGQRIVEAVRVEGTCSPLRFPAVLEVSLKRVEDAAKYLKGRLKRGYAAEHPADELLGRDAHTVAVTVRNIDDFIACI